MKEIFASALFSVSRLDHNTRSCIPYPLQEVHWFLSFLCKPVQRRYTRHKTGKGCRIFTASGKSILTNFLQRQGVGDKLNYVNPLTHMSDQDRISPYNINSISTRWVIRTKKIINLRIISWYNTKFSELTLQECMVDSKENNKFDLGVKGLNKVPNTIFLWSSPNHCIISTI